MVDRRQRRWAEVVYMVYKCLVFAGHEDILSNIAYLFNVGSMLGQRRKRWPSIKTALNQCLV